jgi:hypothetical protein
VASAVLAALVLIAPLFFIPSLVRARVAHTLSSRSGLETKIDDVSPRPSGVTLRGVHLSPSTGEGVQIDVAELDVELGWMAALFQGASAVKSVSASGVDADIDLASPAYATLREKMHSSHSSGSSAPSHRKIEATKFELTLREGKDEVLSLSGVQAEVAPGQITASLERLRASKPGLASAAMGGVDVTLVRGDKLQLQELKVQEATLSIQTPVGMPGAAPPEAAHHDHDGHDNHDGHDDHDDHDDDDAPSEAAPKPAAVDTKLVGAERRQSLQALMARLTPDASLELQRARIEQIIGKERTPVLNDVECQLQVLGGGAVHVTGKGSAQTGGKLDIDMKLWPAELRADGRVTMSALPLTLLVPILPSVPWYEPEKSRVDAELLIKAESPARVSLDGRAALRNGSLASPRLATEPVEGIALSISGKGHWMPLARRLEIDSGSFGIGKARADVAGALEWSSDHYAFDISAQMAPTPCTDAVRSIPNALLGDMALAQWKGTIGGKLRFQVDSRELDKTELKFDIKDHCEFTVVPVIADLSRFGKPFIHTVTEPDGTEFEMETGPGTENWTPIEAMSPYFIYAVMVHEDPQFFNHHGFSPLNIRNAVVRDLKERRYAVGASTISMQLVKNVFLHREKTMARKIQEVLLTWWTERVMEKRDILELYLNVIEYGPSVYGIRNAAKHYWNRLPSELSPAESVFLANILPNPKKFHTYYERHGLSASFANGLKRFLQRLGDRGVYDADAVAYGMQELDHFKFGKENVPAEPRVIPGSAAPLPYQTEERQDTFDANTFGAAPRRFN